MQRRFLDFVGSRRPGLAVLGALIDEYSDGESIVPESVLECALYAVLGRPGMPPFRRQVPLPWAPDRRADAMLDGSPVIIEADGRRWHARHAAFGNDRQRDREGTVHGYDTLRYTYAELTGGSAAVAAEIRAVHDRYQLPSIR